jgi:ABC-2 type transport system ATP-binding protein
VIELVHFTKRYGDLVAVDDLNLKIAPGELFGFIGPNGAGKSTSIRFLATLLKATSGDGRVNGYSVTREPLEVRRSIGYMPDTFGLYDGMRVWDFLDFFAVAYRQSPVGRLSKSSYATRRQVIDEVLGLVNLTAKRKAVVTSLSRGMKQRLCLAKTLLHDPPVLILDEPASGLDPKARIEIKALLKRLAADGKTILISSHVLSELADTCTSIGIIDRGKLVCTGPISEVYRRITRNRILLIKFLDGVEKGVAVIRGSAETRDVQVDGNSVTVELAGDDQQEADLLERLVAAGTRVCSFAEKEATLEDVFLMVTRGTGDVNP